MQPDDSMMARDVLDELIHPQHAESYKGNRGSEQRCSIVCSR